MTAAYAGAAAKGVHADLEYLLAERHLAAALLKHLAALVAADAAATANSTGRSERTSRVPAFGAPVPLATAELTMQSRLPANVWKVFVSVALDDWLSWLCLSPVSGGVLSPNALNSPAALLNAASGAVAGAEARLDHAWLQLPQGKVCGSCWRLLLSPTWLLTCCTLTQPDHASCISRVTRNHYACFAPLQMWFANCP